MAKPKRPKGRQRDRTPKEFQEEVIQLDRVTRVVKGGRRLSFRATMVIGDKKGRVGVGVGKSTEVVGAIKKGVADAKKNLIKVPIFNNTIPHRIQVKYKASKILLMPAGPGTGIIAGGATRKVIELSGITDILSKTLGSNNRLNNSKATIKALKELRERKVPNMKTSEEKTESTEEKAETKAPKKPAKKEAAKKPAAKKTEAKKPAAKKPAKKAAPKKKSE